MKFRIAVLGATGFIGSPYRREIRECPEEAVIVSLCGRRRDLLQAATDKDTAELFTDDWRNAIAHEGVNLVFVCTPDALHHKAVMACAERGLHVVCEKPIGLNAPEALQMWSAYRDRGLGHFVPLWTRYVEVFRKAREICAVGELGQDRAFVYRWHNPRPAAMPFTWRDTIELQDNRQFIRALTTDFPFSCSQTPLQDRLKRTHGWPWQMWKINWLRKERWKIEFCHTC